MFDEKIKQRTNEKYLVKIEKATTQTSSLLHEVTVEDGP
jgi:hypothetical protein